MDKPSSITLDDVLGAFAMDFESGTGVLERYLSQYPEYSLQLVDLSRELLREIDDEGPLSANELATLSAGMRRLQLCTATLQSLEAAPAKVFTDAAKALTLPMQVGLALRERRIDASTIPERLLQGLAKTLQATGEVLNSYLARPPRVSPLRASKSSTKPTAAEKVSFERVLREAGLDDEALSKLVKSD